MTVSLLTGLGSGGEAEGDTFTGIENIYAGEGDDTLTGDSGANVLYGNGGNDILFGNAGDDEFFGGDGDDILNGGAGADELNGHYGNDTADYSGSASAITVDLSTGSASGGDAAGDTFISIENITGSDHDDSITGQSGANVLSGGAGADTIAANSGDDELYGGAGNDVLNAHAGADILSGGTGDDTLNGGDGGDTYLFGRDDGSDTLLELANDSGTDVLSFGADIDETQIWFRQTGLDLEVSLIGTSDKVLVDGWFDSSAQQVEEFHTLDGDVLLNSQVQNLVDAMSAFSPPSAGQTTLPASYEDDLLPVMAANWSSSA